LIIVIDGILSKLESGLVPPLRSEMSPVREVELVGRFGSADTPIFVEIRRPDLALVRKNDVPVTPTVRGNHENMGGRSSGIQVFDTVLGDN
jgi:hypothetical protein